MEAKAKDGQKISGHAPYGFKRSDEDNTRLVIDEYSAGVVRKIFEMRKQELGFYTIAKTLNADHIATPMIYYLTRQS
jgi:DNA invertase Pin-like site-specific DNA recombinase